MASFNDEFDNYIRRRKETSKEPALRSIERRANTSLRRHPLESQPRLEADDDVNGFSATTPLTSGGR